MASPRNLRHFSSDYLLFLNTISLPTEKDDDSKYAFQIHTDAGSVPTAISFRSDQNFSYH